MKTQTELDLETGIKRQQHRIKRKLDDLRENNLSEFRVNQACKDIVYYNKLKDELELTLSTVQRAIKEAK